MLATGTTTHGGGGKLLSESLNARYRRAVKARGHFPTEQAMKCL